MAEHLSPNDEIGIGQAATDKIGFYGATPVVQGAAVTDVPTAGSATAAANATAINAIIARLEGLGLIAS